MKGGVTKTGHDITEADAAQTDFDATKGEVVAMFRRTRNG
jgi:hypothetical protein